MENVNHTRMTRQDPSVGWANKEPELEPSAGGQGETIEEVSGNASAQKVPRKRTKTGCLTCRQRRIKCGEEKPICNNCIKSKRDCKGYGPRLVFKDPLGITGPGMSQQTTFSSQKPPGPPPGEHIGHTASQQLHGGPSQPVLAPKPAMPLALEQPLSSITVPALREFQGPSAAPVHEPTIQRWSHTLPVQEPSIAYRPLDTLTLLDQQRQELSASLDTDYRTDTRTPSQQGTWIPAAELSHSNLLHGQDHPEDDGEDDYYDVESDEEQHGQTLVQNYNQLSLIMASANRDQQQLRSFTTYLNEPNILGSYAPTYGSSPLNNPKTARIFLHFIHATGPSLSVFERHPIDPSTMLGTPVPMSQQGLWTYTLPLKALENQALLQAILAVSSLHVSFLQEAPPTVSLKHYHYALRRVSTAVGLPTRRKQITTLAATLLLGYYEVMGADHSKWNSHVAGSAQLVREIDFAGMTRALRAQRQRVWAQRQMQPPNLALGGHFLFGDPTSEDDPFAEKENSISEKFIGTLTGRAVDYDEFGQVDDGQGSPRQDKHFTRKDIENFRIQCDLYWWYLKQDVLQSMISGGSLFMPFSQWGQCPPRAAAGRLDAIYGSADHLWLLMGRLTDFGVRDRKRKLKAAKVTGSEWQPDSRFAMFMARFSPRRPGQESAGGPVKRPSGPTSGPPFYGMAPSLGGKRPPAAFVNFPDYIDDGEEEDENLSYADAESEWESIMAAFDTFAHALGPYFMPLPPDSVPPISTPFGPALQYRTHNMAVVWGYYYTGRILLHRFHPSMPPAMMVSAKVAAPITAEYGQIIGRIAAGVYYPQEYHLEAGGLSPTLGSCLIEMTVPIFFSAVQYTDSAQRDWVVTKLRELSRLSGWKTSDSIANSCENAWRISAMQGRGPPYERKDHTEYRSASKLPSSEAEIPPAGSSERRFITYVKRPAASWAMGLLSLEDDVLNLEIEDRV
ncbi:C6 finger domain protein [Aspergillus ellipticus CBS 707.79]|uniref:C6 finger domain protein n=1 Tax=Aspergillus ellipticus CBS 707.79 TaxID=1448320 RepID=A0A319DF91_9EURO|nr:C6 finger domain protein [Aspergillus ellipticus CBS 707.79]